jgi:hypothetical protein
VHNEELNPPDWNACSIAVPRLVAPVTDIPCTNKTPQSERSGICERKTEIQNPFGFLFPPNHAGAAIFGNKNNRIEPESNRRCLANSS